MNSIVSSTAQFFYAMNPEHLFVLSLATWRLSNLLVNEDGPFDLFAKVRAVFDIRVDPETKEFYLLKPNVIGDMLLCIMCTSIWVAAAMTLAYLLLPVLTFWFALGLSLSTVTCVIDRWVEGNS